jgi:lysophospholipase L1-like esterase
LFRNPKLTRLTFPALLVGVGACSLDGQQSPAPRARELELEREVESYIRILTDWGGLTRYGSDNTELKPDPNRVVFFGDEITERWGEGKTPFFPGKPYLNRGIGNQATSQMLIRFRQDVINLKPAVVVIQGGSNDLAGFAGPATERTIAENLSTMTELAHLHGIGVVLASVTPVCDCAGVSHTARRPPGRIMGLNGWIRDYAAESHSVFLDYDSVLGQGRFMKPELTADGLVPNDAGYALMAPLAEKALSEAFRARKPRP